MREGLVLALNHYEDRVHRPGVHRDVVPKSQNGDQPVTAGRQILDYERGIPGAQVEDPFSPHRNRLPGWRKVGIDENVVVGAAGRRNPVGRYYVDVLSRQVDGDIARLEHGIVLWRRDLHRWRGLLASASQQYEKGQGQMG